MADPKRAGRVTTGSASSSELEPDWSWPLCEEEQLPPVQSSPRRRSKEKLTDDFAFLPSVGTWLHSLPRPLKVRRRVRVPETIDEPVDQLQAKVQEGELFPRWLLCWVQVYWDRLRIIPRKGPEGLEFEEPLELWLVPSVTTKLEKRLLGVDVVIANETQKVVLRGNGARFNAGLLERVGDAMSRLEESISSKKMSIVRLNVYDLFNWHVGILNNIAWNLWGAGAFHAGLEIYGVEYAFGGVEKGVDGSGITTCRPRQCVKHSFRESHCLGVTRLSEQEVEELLHELAPDWSVQEYETLGPNCITFCRCLSQRLGVRQVPEWVDSVARSLKERQPIEPEGSAFCPHGHRCQLQTQAILAGFVEVLDCEICDKVITAGVPHWHCAACAVEICDDCAGHVLEF